MMMRYLGNGHLRRTIDELITTKWYHLTCEAFVIVVARTRVRHEYFAKGALAHLPSV